VSEQLGVGGWGARRERNCVMTGRVFACRSNTKFEMTGRVGSLRFPPFYCRGDWKRKMSGLEPMTLQMRPGNLRELSRGDGIMGLTNHRAYDDKLFILSVL
jgi:hypothetical protein